MKNVIVVAGPTAVGKTTVSIELAKTYQVPVISADSRQVYRQMNIGTAKPTREEMQEVRHYMVDNKDIQENYNAYQFETEVLRLLNREIWPHFNQVVITGGSGLYIDALCKGIDLMPDIPKEIRQKWKDIFKHNGIEHLQRELSRMDPVFFAEVDQANPKRLLRALEVIEVSGRPFSAFRQNKPKQRDFNIIKTALELPRDILYNRIELRMDEMIGRGLFSEAEALFPDRDLQALQTVGYREIFDFMEGKYDREEAIRLLKRNSRRYAKRQMTWFKKDKEYQWFSPDQLKEMIEYINSNLQ